MKKTVKTVLVLLLSFCVLLPLGMLGAYADEGEPGVLYDADANIKLTELLPAGPTGAETLAAETLCGYLEEITGERPALANAAPAVGSDPASETKVSETSGGLIRLALTETLAGKPKGSYKLSMGKAGAKTDSADPVYLSDSVFRIEAADARGLLNGVYGFLRRVCGVQIYAADVKKVPKATKIGVAVPYEYEYTPTLEYADTDWLSPHDLEFALANGLNGSYSPLEPVHGGKVNYIWFCHSLTGGIVPRDELFETHPEYYALRDGERKPTQLCLSNPEVVKRAIDDVKKQLAASYNPDAAINIVSVTQADNQEYCTCENCNAIASQYGAQSGLMLWFVNQIADAVAPEYPDVVIDTFAYQYTRQAPTGIEPRDNVCVRLCSIECCFSHAFDDPACGVNAEFMRDLENWSKISNRLYVWDYVTNFVQTLGIFPDFGVLRRNIDVLRAHSVVGIYEEGAYYASSCNVGFFDLSAYLLSCFMRDELTDEEEKDLTRDFMNGYYGGEQAGAAINEILDILVKHAGDENGHLYIWQGMRYTLVGITDEEIRRVDELWKIALSSARENGDAEAEKRIERSRLSWRYYEACVHKGEAAGLLPGMPNLSFNRALIDDLAAAGVTRYNEGKTMDGVHAYAFLTPADWETGDEDFGAVKPVAIAAGVALLLALAAAVFALIKKHPLCALLIVLFAAASVPLGVATGQLFIEWDHLGVYGFWDAVMLLTVAGFCFIAAWALNGCRRAKGKKAVLTVFLCLLIAAVPYEVTVLMVNTVIYESHRPLYSITVSALCQIAVMILALVLTVVGIARADKKQKNAG